MKSLLAFLLSLVLLAAFGIPSFAGSKSVYVKGYVTKKGTYVAPHYRSAPGTSSSSWSSPTSYRSKKTERPLGAPRWDTTNHIDRSFAQRSAFMRSNPCPSTGKTYGACPGFVVDHITALKSGGADAPLNMQWQTIEQGKAKDKWE